MSSTAGALLCGLGMLAFIWIVLWLNGSDDGD
jgi:hypothetical protein